MPLISVIVPVYKVEKYLRKCIDSILSQTYKDFELILVDDGSPDNCPLICDEYAKEDSRIVVIHKENGGLSSARNAGLDYVFANSSNEYISFVDSDDYVRPEYLTTLYRGLINHSCDISRCNVKEVIDGVDSSSISVNAYDEMVVDENGYWSIENYPKTVAWGALYKKSIFNNLRFLNGRNNEDGFIIHRVIGQCSRIFVTFNNLYIYSRREDSITLSTPQNRIVIDYLDIWLDRLSYYTYEHINDTLAYINFLKAWRDLKYCLVNRLVSYRQYEKSVNDIRHCYSDKYKRVNKYHFTNVIFLFMPRFYIMLHNCLFRYNKK